MNQSHTKFLALATATKRLGAVIFSNTELAHFSVRTFGLPRTRRRAKEEVSTLIDGLILEYEPDYIVIKGLGTQQARSKHQQFVTNLIRQYAAKKKIRVAEVSFEKAKAFLSSGKKSTKENAFGSVSVIYPELKRFVIQRNSFQREYYNSLLSAVAVGLYFQNPRLVDLNRRHKTDA